MTLLFMGCLLPMPYSYFQLVRVLGMTGSLSRTERINPLFKIALGRTVWNIVDVIWAVILIGSVFYDNKRIN